MAEYIDRQKAIDAIKRWDQQKLYLPADFREMLEEIPTADVRPVVRGRWEKVEVTWLADVEDQPDAIASMFCSECRRFANHVFLYGNPRDGMNFCPHCGARMGGDAE